MDGHPLYRVIHILIQQFRGTEMTMVMEQVALDARALELDIQPSPMDKQQSSTILTMIFGMAFRIYRLVGLTVQMMETVTTTNQGLVCGCSMFGNTFQFQRNPDSYVCDPIKRASPS